MSQKTRIIVMDGGGRMHTVNIYDNFTGKNKQITIQELVDLPLQDELFGVPHSRFDEVSILSEQAHWTVRVRSLAQILKDAEMKQLISNTKNTNFVIQVWPEKLTPRALHKYNLTKDSAKGENDCEAIAKLASTMTNNLKKIKSPKDTRAKPQVLKGRQWRQEVANNDMNMAQSINYGLIKKTEEIYSDFDLCPVSNNIILPNYHRFLNASEMTKIFFNLVDPNDVNTLEDHPHLSTNVTQFRHLVKAVTKTTNPRGVDFIFEMRGLYAVANAVVDYEGDPRMNPLNEKDYMSNKFFNKHYAVNNHHHQQGGVARAIFYNYVFPTSVGHLWNKQNPDHKWPPFTNTGYNRGDLSEEQDAFLVDNRKIFKKSCLEVADIVRDIVGVPMRSEGRVKKINKIYMQKEMF